MPEAVIVSAVRTAVGKAFKGTLRTTRPDDLGAVAIHGALARVPELDREGNRGRDPGLRHAGGRAGPERGAHRHAARRPAGGNLRHDHQPLLRLGTAGHRPGRERIAAGGAEVIVAGGTESMSMIPLGGHKVSCNPWLVENYPDSYLSMGLTAERIAQRFGISRQQADEFSYQSHQKALAAIASGAFEDEIVPVPVTFATPAPQATRGAAAAQPALQTIEFKVDEGPRADTTLEALAALKPAFHARGTVTAGNSSQMSDGAAAAVVMTADRARALGLKPLARFVAFATAGCKPEEMGLGPIYAIPKALKLAGLTLDQIGVIELNEAFAAQALAVIR